MPIVLAAELITKLPREVTIDLPAQTVAEFKFDMPEGDKKMLIDGLDMIAQTLEHEADISAFLDSDKVKRPWIY